MDDPDKLGAAIDAAFKKGATGIEEIEFLPDEEHEDEIYDQLIKLAFEDAKAKAKDYAE